MQIIVDNELFTITEKTPNEYYLWVKLSNGLKVLLTVEDTVTGCEKTFDSMALEPEIFRSMVR